jgi:hypothetical protein
VAARRYDNVAYLRPPVRALIPFAQWIIGVWGQRPVSQRKISTIGGAP